MTISDKNSKVIPKIKKGKTRKGKLYSKENVKSKGGGNITATPSVREGGTSRGSI